jgi:hypothetical protein
MHGERIKTVKNLWVPHKDRIPGMTDRLLASKGRFLLGVD